MHWLTVQLALFSAAAAAGVRRETAPKDATNQFILEVAPGSDVEALAQELTTRRGARVLRKYASSVFSGLSVESDTDNVDSLQELAQVARAWGNQLVPFSPEVPSVTFANDGAAAAAQNYSVHKWTGVDRLHAAGVYGKGAIVAVVDTGIDYMHPALGGGFGPGFKVTQGTDFVGGRGWPNYGPRQPDDDPMDGNGHGTHVSGIIAGKTDWFTGVAPEAELRAYKVFSDFDSGGTTEDVLIEAFTRAYEDGADIITASIGSSGGWAESPWAMVASRIVDQGVVVTISAGNEGETGPAYGSTGSSGHGVLAVASATAGTLPALPFDMTFSVDGRNTTNMFAYLPNYYTWTIGETPIHVLSFNTTDTMQACEPMPADTPDLAGKITLVLAGGCDLIAKEFNLRAFNLSHMMLYTLNQKPVEPSTWLSGPKALVDEAVGLAIVEAVRAGGAVTADFSKHLDSEAQVGMFNAVGNRPSYYTTWGGLYDMDIKPDVAAPGQEILSSYPGEQKWAMLSGTSMSCPYVAGVAALYISKHGGRRVHGPGFAKMLNNRIVASGAAMPWATTNEKTPGNTGFWAPVPQVGSGLINAYKVLESATHLSFQPFVLNDTHHFSRYHSVDITNAGPEDVTYAFSVQPAAGIEARSSRPNSIAVLSDLKPIVMNAQVGLPRGTFKVKAGETKKADFSFDYPRGLNESSYPFFSGKVLISGSNGDELSVPYFGAAFNIKKQFDSVFTNDSLRSWHGYPQQSLSENATLSFDLKTYDYLQIFASLKWGTAELRWDIFEAGFKERNWKYPPVVGQNGYVGSVAIWALSGRYQWVDPTSHDIETTIPMPMLNMPRNGPIEFTRRAFYWLGKLTNGTTIAPGAYSMRFAALRPFGNRAASDNWEVFQLPDFTVT